ncbi:MAG: hypothetical protein KDH88_00500 [Chromatiales bacterium]|nr:hypothetical protein [Chromatiales bacterium]
MKALSTRRERGAALVTGLILMGTLTLIGVLAITSTVNEQRMTGNQINRQRAMEAAEALRLAAAPVVEAHIYTRGWPTSLAGGQVGVGDFNQAIPAQFSFATDADSVVPDLYNANGVGENPNNTFSMTTDITYRLDGNGDGDYEGELDRYAELKVYRTVVSNAPGSAIAMVQGYEGVGMAAGAGGSHLFMEFRGVGKSANGARVVVGSEYRHVIRN